ncbi:MAG: NAD-dependent epimerase/dehydratase family protein [Promethearchaeota archaeon]
MKILVTGANGFVGSNFCKYLASKQIYPKVLVRKTSDLSLLKQMVPKWRNFDFFYGDLREASSLRSAVKDVEIIYHIAGTIKGSSWKEFYEGNFIGTTNLIKICREENPGLKRFVFISSMVAGGSGTPKNPQCEKIPSKPLENDWYGISKYLTEQYCKKQTNSFPIVMVRPPAVFGPGDQVSLNLFKLAKSHAKLFVTGPPRQMSLVHVEDLVNGIYICGNQPKIEGEIFGFSSDGIISYRDIHEVIATKVFKKRYGHLFPLAIPPSIFYIIGFIMEKFGQLTGQPPFINRPKAIQATALGQVMSNQKAKKILGWVPEYNIIFALKDTGKWYQRNSWL